MKTPSTLVLSCSVLLIGIGWAGIRTVQALQDTPAAAEKAVDKKSSDAAPGDKPATESTPEDKAGADQLLSEARSQLLNRQSLQADMQQQIILGERRLEAAGTYLSGPFPKLRLEYKIRVGSMQGALTEICDGTILHTEKAIGKVGAKDPDVVYTRRDVQKILAATENSLNLPVASLGAEMGIGGLPAILASIDRCMIGQRVTDEEFEGQKCRVYYGRWDPVILQKYQAGLGENAKEILANLVPFFPDSVRVHFAADTLLPVKITYLKNEQNETGAVTGERAIMFLAFRNMKMDQPVLPTAFKFVLPTGREEVDTTNDFLKLIEQANASIQAAPAPGLKK